MKNLSELSETEEKILNFAKEINYQKISLAEFSQGLNLPLTFLHKILCSLEKRNILTLLRNEGYRIVQIKLKEDLP